MSESRGRRSPNMSPWSGSRHSNHENAAVYRPRMPLPVSSGLRGQNDTLETQGTSDALSHCSSSMGLNPSVEGEKIELSLVEVTESCAVSLPHHDLSHNVNISGPVDKSEPSQERSSPQSSSGIDDLNQVKCQAVIEPFDICLPKIGTPVMLKPSLLVKNREKRNEIKRSAEGQIGNVLRPGMVLLKKYLSLGDQVRLALYM
ncbi:hypothetical protein Golob_006679, partial [Gossypium lobatum]|nr:hypothetical protein [Gossypium lobatum]